MKYENGRKSSFFLLLIAAIAVTLMGMAVTYVGVENFNSKNRRAELSKAV
nr:hypothetical protein [Lachnospiraceae bacterium]